MPQICLDTADAVELAELLQFIARWLTADPATLVPSFLACTGHPAYGLDQLRADPGRFTFGPSVRFAIRIGLFLIQAQRSHQIP